MDQTPIEVLLGIDDNGMTTAKKLYEFLELEPKNYSRWCNANILNNKFADIDKDYFPFVVQEERNNYSSSTTSKRGNFATDYKLTSEFAKQLSMLSKSERGEQARQYFLICEKALVMASKKLSQQQNSLSATPEMFQMLLEQNNKILVLLTSRTQPQYEPQFTYWLGKTYKKRDILAEYNGITKTEMLHSLYNELQDTYDDIDLNECRYEYCFQRGIPDNKLYTMNAIGADTKLKQLFDLMINTRIEQMDNKQNAS